MAFTHAAASYGVRTRELLPADKHVPERHIVMETLRNAAPRLGLKAPVLATLDAMLSCLSPKRNHHTVFASNETLVFRRDGLSDRTIRRHVAILQDLGLLERRDSANGKRFTKMDRHRGIALRFGFDLTPLFDRLHEIATLASDVLREKEELAYLRAKIRAAANQLLNDAPDDATALETIRFLRRKVSLVDCQDEMSKLEKLGLTAGTETPLEAEKAPELAASHGQNVRHHQKSKKEITDKSHEERSESTPRSSEGPTLTLNELLETCPDAAEFSMSKIQSFNDVISHAQTLAPMIGVDQGCYQAAQKRLGPLGAAITIWAVIQIQNRVHRTGAYFRAITSGKRSDGFDPLLLVKRIGTGCRSHEDIKYCPRTIQDSAPLGSETYTAGYAQIST